MHVHDKREALLLVLRLLSSSRCCLTATYPRTFTDHQSVPYDAGTETQNPPLLQQADSPELLGQQVDKRLVVGQPYQGRLDLVVNHLGA